MKSRIPSVWRSIRELWLASGGPWCSLRVAVTEGDGCALHQALPPPLGDGRGDRGGRAADLDVLDLLLGDLADPADQVLLEPARALAGEGRDQDLVDPVVLDRVLDGLEGVGAHRLAGRVDVGAVELGQGRGEVADDLGLADVLGPRADDRVAVRAGRRRAP